MKLPKTLRVTAQLQQMHFAYIQSFLTIPISTMESTDIPQYKVVLTIP